MPAPQGHRGWQDPQAPMVRMGSLDSKAGEERRAHRVLRDFLVLPAELDPQALLELQGRQGPSGSLGRRGPQVFEATLALMGEWEIEDQPAPLGAQETKGTPEKTGSLVRMAPPAQLAPRGREGSSACRGSAGSEACRVCQAPRAHQEKWEQRGPRETKGPLGPWAPQARTALSGSRDLRVRRAMTALQAGTAPWESGVTVETPGPQVCQALRVPQALPAQLVPQETQDREETRVPGVP